MAKRSPRLTRSSPTNGSSPLGLLQIKTVSAWTLTKGKRIDDHLAGVHPEAVLDEIAHVDFASSAWKKNLLRSKPPMNTAERRILPSYSARGI